MNLSREQRMRWERRNKPTKKLGDKRLDENQTQIRVITEEDGSYYFRYTTAKEEKKMNLRELAQKRTPKQTLLNIADYPNAIPVDLEVKEGNGTDKQGVSYEYFYVELDGEQYRVPQSVISQLNGLLEFGDVKAFRVTKTGSGMATRYIVRPA